MKKQNKSIVAAFLATSALAFGVGANAEQPGANAGGCEEKPGMMMRGPGQMMGDRMAMAEQRLNELKAQLKLTPQQEPLWQAYANKLKSEAGQGAKAMRDKAQDQVMSAPERMSMMMSMMKERMTVMQSANDSFKKLYDALSTEQKAIADKQAAHFGRMQPPGMGGQGGGMGGTGRGPQG
jgi:hypothetical protein